MKQDPHRQFFKFVKKNAIKSKMVYSPLRFCPKSIDSPKGFWQKFEPPPPPGFSAVCIYCMLEENIDENRQIIPNGFWA
jgi:hypothetical protein